MRKHRDGRRRWAWGVILMLLGGCAGRDALSLAFGPDGRSIREAIDGFPLEKQEEFRLLEARCARCHTLEPAFDAHVMPGRWRLVVRAMERKVGSGISTLDGDRIAGFLEYFWKRRREAQTVLEP